LLYHSINKDEQQPHRKDEYYFVAKGSGEFIYDGKNIPFKTGDLLFPAAMKEHRFVNFTDDLLVWVLFYGPDKH
jgi:mannose-6-phosphate isomerase-like protein (cupin superfamily)